MTNRFVVFSDLHLHEWSYGSTLIHGRNSRLEQQKEVVLAIVRYCNDNGIRTAFFCGDLFHTHTITAQVSQAAYEAFKAFKESGITLHVLEGNHDQADRRGEIHALSWFRELGNLYVHGSNDGESAGHFLRRANKTSLSFAWIPFTEDAERLSAGLKEIREGFVFLHQGVSGVEVNSKGFTLNEILTPDMIHPDVAMAFSGHYHSFKQASHNLIIPGSTMQLNWGDQGEPRGWLDVEVEDGQVKNIQLIQSPASRFITVYEGNLAQADDITGNFIRVVSHGDYSPEELSSAVMERGAVSCEIKIVRGENKPVRTVVSSMASFNEVVYSFADAKVGLGVIDEYDKMIGERLLRGNYEVPQV